MDVSLPVPSFSKIVPFLTILSLVRSDFTNAVPPQSLRNTTATPILPSSTAYYAAAPSATDAAYWANDDAQSLRIGLGVGLGLGIPLALCAALALWWHFRRRRRRIEGGIPYRKQGGTFEVQSVRHSKGGTPNMPNEEAEFGTDTLVEAGPEKDSTRWYGRPGPEGTYEASSVPASPGQCACLRSAQAEYFQVTTAH